MSIPFRFRPARVFWMVALALSLPLGASSFAYAGSLGSGLNGPGSRTEPTGGPRPPVKSAGSITGSSVGSGAGASWCRHPAAKNRAPGGGVAGVIVVGEVEPNDTPGTAQAIDLGSSPGQSNDIDITGAISPTTDIDHFSFSAVKGDVIGIAALGAGAPDTVLSVLTAGGGPLLINDDHQSQASIYPPTSPFPGGVHQFDSALTWIAPANGTYLVRLASFFGSSSGPYTIQIRSRRPAMELQNPPATQTVFLDFDGATINPNALFGAASTSATLSPLGSFLSAWGLPASSESAVIDSIIATVAENFNDLRIPSLNGDRDTDMAPGHFDVELLNSRDHADPFGSPNISRVIIGGTASQLGIPTIGIAESVDPGNFATRETAVVLLDILSHPPGDPDSINTLARVAGFSQTDAVGRVVGNIVTHEIGHYLGNWHTDADNGTRCLMDSGGDLAGNMAGVGLDGIMGTGDDVDTDFVADAYAPPESIGVGGQERTDVRTAFALATGAVGSVPNDLCSNAMCVADGEPVLGSTEGASADGEAVCSDGALASVWYTYTPAVSGPVTISLCGSAYDTFLAVFESCGGASVACDDDGCVNGLVESETNVNLVGGTSYLVRVSGWNGSFGDYTLSVTGGMGTCEACAPASAFTVEATLSSSGLVDSIAGLHSFEQSEPFDSQSFPGQGFTVQVSSGASALPGFDWFTSLDFSGFSPSDFSGGTGSYTLTGMLPIGAGIHLLDAVATDAMSAVMPGSIGFSDTSIQFDNLVDELLAGGSVLTIHWVQECSAPACTIVSSNPPNCAIDARQPHPLDTPSPPFGWDSVLLPLDCPAGVPFPTAPADFEVSTTSGVAPAVVQVIPSGNSAALILSGPIPAGSWTCISLVDGGNQVCLGHLPGDVDGDGISAPSDILAVIDSLNGVAPRPDYATDADRSNAAGPEDILRVIDLLNGAASFAPWLDAGIGACPSGP